MAALWKAATSNAFNTTLNGSIATSDTTIPLTSVTGLQAPGVLVLDRQDASGNDTPTLREYVSFTGIAGNSITGCARGLGGSAAQAHSSSAKVEETLSVTHWNDLISALLNVLTLSGSLDTSKAVDLASSQTLSNKALNSPSISGTVNGSFTFGGVTTFKSPVSTLVTDPDGATVTFDISQGTAHKVTLGGNRTLAVSNAQPGQCFIVHLKQDATGSRTVTWWSGIIWTNTSVPVLTTTGNKIDSFGFQYDGTNYYGYIVGQNVG